MPIVIASALLLAARALAARRRRPGPLDTPGLRSRP